VYLRVKQNRVSDVINVQTADLVECDVRVVYQLDFEGDDPKKWFDVEDYVKFITDNCRSRLRNAAKKLGIEEFHENYIDIVRDTILGKVPEAAEGAENPKRAGRFFSENASRIYEVDVLELTIGNDEIRRLLIEAQRDAVKDTLELRKQRRLLIVVEETEQHARQTAEFEAETKMQRMTIDAKEKVQRDAIGDAELNRRQARIQNELEGEQNAEEMRKQITEAVLVYKKLDDEFIAMQVQRKLDQSQEVLAAETASYVARAEAISSDLIASLQQLAATGSAKEIAEAMGIPAYLNGESPYSMLHRMLAGTGLDKFLPKPPTNGGSNPSYDEPNISQ
jgi:major vault protein